MKKARPLLGSLCLGVLAVILSLGLWPFHGPDNDAAWIGGLPGLRLGKHSTLLSSVPLAANAEGGSIAMWVRAASLWDGGTLLSFARPGGESPFAMRQSLTDLLLETEVRDASGRARTAHAYVPDVFRGDAPVLITVTAGREATHVYVNGRPSRTPRRWRVAPEALGGRLIVGDAPGQSDSWAGILRGVALYQKELTAPEVRRQYDEWIRQGRPETGERCAALYLFEEGAGRVAHSQVRPGPDLQMPAKYKVVDKKVLEPFWEEFRRSEGDYWRAALKNIVGFLPVGFVFYPYLRRRTWRALAWTVAAGFLISATIEVGQIFLPTRDSGTSDLITNTLGTYLGVLLYQAVNRPWLAGRFPWLGFLFSAGE